MSESLTDLFKIPSPLMPLGERMNISESDDVIRKIESTRIEIANLEATIAALSANQHEVADATAQLHRQKATLEFLVQAKLEGGKWR
jgi:hypothetical protein